MRHLKPSIHSVSACEPRPSAASIAALYPRIACSLDMTPLVRGFSSGRRASPLQRRRTLPMSTQVSARAALPRLSCPSTAFHTSPPR